jgi:DNA-binding transcriptional LysR family regulator
MDQLRLMKVFVAVAEERGFSTAARRMGMSPPAVTRAISQLEEELGVKLLQRSTRYVRPTDAGRVYLENALRILDDVDAANAAVSGVHTEPTGLLSVTAPVLFGQMYVMPTITRYLQSNPGINIDAVFLDRVVNMLEEGLDVAVRIGHLPDSNAMARKVGSVGIICCASPEYLARNRMPQTPADLKEQSLISSRGLSPVPEWRFAKDGKAKVVKVVPRLTVTSNSGAIEAARAGFGIARLISYQVAPYLADGSLKTVLSNYALPSMPIHILHREGRLATVKVRSFIDLLSTNLRNELNHD